jgi:hypothetical protein
MSKLQGQAFLPVFEGSNLTMLRLKLCVLTVAFVLGLGLMVTPRAVRSESGVVRLTNTVEQAVNLNTSLSDYGRVVVFE